jgi:hypothetical protein
VITQISLQVANGANSLLIAPNGNGPIPLPLVLLEDELAPRKTVKSERAPSKSQVTEPRP